MHGKHAPFKIQIAPAKAEKFASTKASRERQQLQRPVRIVLRLLEKPPRGETALITAAFWRPDLVIADALLPGLYGLRVIDTLRQQDPLLPVIVISAIADVLERPEFVPAGLDLRSIAFLAKPFGIYGP